MLIDWAEFSAFLQTRLDELTTTQFDQVRYGDAGLAILLAIALSGALLLTAYRLLFRIRGHARYQSGHLIHPKLRRGTLVRALYHLPKLLLLLAVATLLVAASDPFLTGTEEVTGDVESRVRVDLVDTSLSMAWEFPETGRSRAEVARAAHLQFLEMRREKNDRVSLWMFSSYPYMVDDFILDDELYYFQVFEAPYVTVRLLAPQFRSSRDQIHVPPDKVRIIPTEGNTNLVRALQSVVKFFDSDAASSRSGANLHRAVLIITDADVDEVPAAELAALNQRNIVPYMIYINVRDAGGEADASEEPPLIDMIREYGGDYFDVTDERSLVRAYEAIDELEAVRVELSHRAVRTPIYPRVLLVSLALLVVGIPAGFLAELVWGTHP